jgi:hypothetical protein
VVTKNVSGPLLHSFTTRYEISTDTSGYGNPPDVVWPAFANVGPNDLFLIFINRESHKVDTLISIPTIDDDRVHECNLVLDLSSAATDDQKVAVVEAALKNSPGPWVLDHAFLIASRDLATSRENWMLQLCQKHIPSPSASATQPTEKPAHSNFDNTSLAGTQATFRFLLQTATTSSAPANRLTATRLIVRWMAARPLICADALPLLAQVVNRGSARSSEILSPAEKAGLVANITALPAPSPPLATLKKQCLDWLAGDH